jgi:hypothetical protein
MEKQTGTVKGAATYIAAIMEKTQYENIIEELRQIKKKIDDIDDCEAKDRERLQDQNIELQNLKTEMQELRRAYNRSAETIKNSVADVVEPLVGSTMDLQDTIDKSKKVLIKEKTKSIWKIIFRS